MTWAELEAAGLVDLVDGFVREVDAAEADATKCRGGQHVNFTGDFVGFARVPHIRGRLLWWAREFRDARSKRFVAEYSYELGLAALLTGESESKAVLPRCSRCAESGWVTSPEAAGCKKHMPDPRTPGQVAFEAARASAPDHNTPTWCCLDYAGRDHWEAIAAAVLAHGRGNK